MPAVSARISGQLLGMPWLTQQLLGLSVDEAVYGSTWGQPSVVMLLPYSSALPSSMVSSCGMHIHSVSFNHMAAAYMAAAYSTHQW